MTTCLILVASLLAVLFALAARALAWRIDADATKNDE